VGLGVLEAFERKKMGVFGGFWGVFVVFGREMDVS